jgi:threonylcarbamoyladenosine tRNA methylthiotransferase MtaB
LAGDGLNPPSAFKCIELLMAEHSTSTPHPAKRIAFKTFGCRANSLDTDAMTLEATRRGYQIVDDADEADTYVINSCTVTHAADKETRILAQRLKKKNPDSKVAVVGCYAQVAKDDLASQPAVDFVLGTANKLELFDLLTDGAFDNQRPPQTDSTAESEAVPNNSMPSVHAIARGQTSVQQVRVPQASGFLPDAFPGSRNSRANIKIQDGCNFSCSYCIIPEARGRSRSLPLEKALEQVQQASDQGFEEVVLTGIHLAHYGWDKKTNLLALVRAILDMPNGPRLRLSTLDPFEICDELIALVGTHPKLCPYFHIALQSGSNPVLKAMRRIYRAEEFVKVTNKIREQCPSVFIGVDVIVGFPQETDEAFQETVRCLEASHWTKLHVFPFSLRRGTRAEALTETVPREVAQARSLQLRQWSDARLSQFLKAQVGTEQGVLVEKRASRHPGYWQGHTANYTPVLLAEPSHLGMEAKRTYFSSLTHLQDGFVVAEVAPVLDR